MNNNTLEIAHGIRRMLDNDVCLELLMDCKREIDALSVDPSNQPAIDTFKRMIKNVLVKKGGFVDDLVIDDRLLGIIEHTFNTFNLERLSPSTVAMKHLHLGAEGPETKPAGFSLISNGTTLEESKWLHRKEYTNPMTRREIAGIINTGVDKGLNLGILSKLADEIKELQKEPEKYCNVITSLTNMIKSEIDITMPDDEEMIVDDKVLEVIKFLVTPIKESDMSIITVWLSE